MRLVFYLAAVISTFYTCYFGWGIYKTRNRFGAFTIWTLAAGTLIGAFWIKIG